MNTGNQQQAEIFPTPANGRGVIGILGPTNTGKTHLAIERMAAHNSGLIGLPLRLLAREVYQRLGNLVGFGNVALITGEEKINSDKARYRVCTVEAMPIQTDAAFVAIDEVQMAADLERGHIFTDRIMNLRGKQETLLLGASTIENTLRALLPGIEIRTRPRMSVLEYAGSKKITRLPPRTAIVAFSANEVYAIAELIRRQRGGAAIVMGALSPRTRNAQVELYQSGDVDFLVATDAIGMGLNLDLNHVAFAQETKFDGFQHRRLTAAEMGQIAGRAGRHTRNGTFGVTGRVSPLEDELVERLEIHEFEPAKVLTWRNRDLDFRSIDTLKQSLERTSNNRLLMKALPASDQIALETLSRDYFIADAAKSSDTIKLLWEVCLMPDYRKISPASHAELLHNIFRQLISDGNLNEDWYAKHIRHADQTTGDIDTLSIRIAQMRTWTYLSHRADWLPNATYWQEKARAVEDKLSDVLHDNLTKRFIDRRTSVLMKRLRENTHMEAEIQPNGDVKVEGHHIGRLSGFRFTPDTVGGSPEAKAANAAAGKALAGEIEKRAGRLAAAPNADIILSSDGILRWQGDPIARLVSGETVLSPRVILLADEQLSGPARDQAANRLDRWLANHLANVLKPLIEMSRDQTLDGMARGVAYRLIEALGNIERREIAADIQALTQDKRADLRRHGVRFGFYNIFIPALLKPAPVELLCLLWALHNNELEAPGRNEIVAILASGRTSTIYDPSFENEFYRLSGYRILGEKAVRMDILERLADLIRPALFWKSNGDTPHPEGAVDGRSFYVTPAMMSILGATHEDMELILKGLGYQSQEKLESEIKPVKAGDAQTSASKSEPAAKTEGRVEGSGSETNEAELVGSAENGQQAAVIEKNSTMSATQDTNVTPASDEQAGTGSDGTASDTEGDTVPKTILIWQPASRAPRDGGNRKGHDAKPGQKHKKSQRGRGKQPAQAAGHKTNKPGRSSGQGKENRSSPKIDPDSPFAKLQALKQQMKDS